MLFNEAHLCQLSAFEMFIDTKKHKTISNEY